MSAAAALGVSSVVEAPQAYYRGAYSLMKNEE